MSLINDVLRDLDRRRPANQSGLLGGVRPSSSGGGRGRGAAGLLCALLALGAGLGVYLLWPAPPAEQAELAQITSAPLPTALLEPDPDPESASNPAATPAELTAINYSRSSERLRLRLRIEGESAYEVLHEDEDRRVRLLLPGVRLAAEMPALTEDEPRLLSLRSRAEDEALTLMFAFDRPVRVQTHLEENAGGADLRVDLYPQERVVAAVGRQASASTTEPEPDPAPKPRQMAEPEATPEPARAESAPDEASAGFRREPAASSQERARRAHQRALASLRSQRPEQALAHVRESLQLYPELHAARETLIVTLLRLGRAGDAEQQLQQAMAEWPEQAVYFKLYARLLMDAGARERAATVLEQGLPARVGDGEYYALLAALYQQQERYQDSARLYRRLLEAHPERALWWLGLAISLEGGGARAEARDAYERALRERVLDEDLREYALERWRALGGS